MDTMGRNDSTLLSQLVELTSDAVAVCDASGTVLHVNRQLMAISNMARSALVGADIKDLIFSESFERAADHRLPFTLDGSDCTLMLKLADGSFIPVLARAIAVSPLRQADDAVVLDNSHMSVDEQMAWFMDLYHRRTQG